MFKLSKVIPNDGEPCFVTEACFQPDGKRFGVTFEQNNEVRLYDTDTLSLVRVLRNPAAGLDRPHGILLTARHLIVTNRGVSPSTFTVFRLDDESGTASHTYTPPYSHLAEGHSIALHGRRLVVSYCEGATHKGAIVSYDYDDETGKIAGALDIQERWFRRYGDTKGICFDESGSRVYVTFESKNWDMASPRETVTEFLKNRFSLGYFGATYRNGLTSFGIDARGRFTRRPLWTHVFGEFCRLENIQIRGNRAVVSNPVSGCVYVYDLGRTNPFETPAQVLTEGLVFPHGVKLSPDGNRLVVTDYGIEVANRRIRWKSYVAPRRDRVVVFDLQTA